MGRPRTFDLEEALETATALFWRDGYDRTSLGNLTTALRIAPASFYLAFESKEALFRRLVDRYVASQTTMFERAFEASTLTNAVHALLRGYADVVTDDRHAAGCLVVNSSPSIESSDALRRWLSSHREKLRERLEARFSDAYGCHGLPGSVGPRTAARFVLTLAGGLAVEARAGASRDELYAVIALAMCAFATPMREV